MECLDRVEEAMVIAFTGHRRFGHGPTAMKIKQHVEAELRRLLLLHRPAKAISGMAIGTDQWAAAACIELGIPFIAAVPCSGQESRWPLPAQQQYRALLARAAEVVIVTLGAYNPSVMHARNKWMVDNSDLLIAALMPRAKTGGTAACVGYARHVGRRIEFVDPLGWMQGTKEGV